MISRLEQLLRAKEPAQCSADYPHGRCDYVAPMCMAHQAYTDDVRAFDKLLHASAPALLRVAKAAEAFRSHESAFCLVDPPCGKCDACELRDALAALETNDGG